ncbi:MAG: T9SS type A sorting domain-containing protein [Bacteroidetes bacterium]|nr:T9SS type A sorting domain-containing protein [Bacteroidota bacterium]MBL7104115.1 T9SS type A sorting domain-containing protein [Bacteroidales bacterium]
MKRIYLILTLLAVFISNFSISQDFSTLGEIYDFDVGDEFQFKYYQTNSIFNDTSYYIERKVILEKSVTTEKINYTYKADYIQYDFNNTPPTPIDTIYLNLIDSLIISNPDSIIFTEGDTVIYNPELYNGRKICIKNIMIGNGFIHKRYVDGCGCAYYSDYYFIAASSSVDSMIYYKKGTEEWGTPVLLNIHNEISLKNNFILYPNPTNEQLFIKLNSSHITLYSIHAFNLFGRNVIGDITIIPEYKSNAIRINCSRLKKGVYFIILNSDKGSISKRFIKL